MPPFIAAAYAAIVLALGIPRRRKKHQGRHRAKAGSPQKQELSARERDWVHFLHKENKDNPWQTTSRSLDP